MRDCKHLDVTPPQELKPGLWCEPVELCVLKTSLGVRVKMAQEATAILGRLFPPNTECHYYNFDMCEKCPSYAK
jgi:hypothetical protein